MTGEQIDSLISKKRLAKKNLSDVVSFNYKKPLVGVFLDTKLTKKDEETLKGLFDGVANLGLEMVVVADTNLDFFKNNGVKILPYSRKNRKLLLEASDMALSFSFNDVHEMFLYGIVPVTGERPEVKNYDPTHETGNSFVYNKENTWSVFAALVRALETYKFPYDWKSIVRSAIDSIED